MTSGRILFRQENNSLLCPSLTILKAVPLTHLRSGRLDVIWDSLTFFFNHPYLKTTCDHEKTNLNKSRSVSSIDLHVSNLIHSTTGVLKWFHFILYLAVSLEIRGGRNPCGLVKSTVPPPPPPDTYDTHTLLLRSAPFFSQKWMWVNSKCRNTYFGTIL
jgi:hypothetical protein